MGDMPTPERLVTEDMLPDRYNKSAAGGGEMDNKVANFLAVRCFFYTYFSTASLIA